MYITTLTGCCGAKVIYNFGGGECYNSPRMCKTIKNIKKELVPLLTALKRQQYNMVIATTMDNQKRAEKALASLGFYTGGQHKTVRDGGNRKMSVWFLPLSEWEES